MEDTKESGAGNSAATTYRMTYFDSAMSERTAQRCAYEARRYSEDIVGLVFSESTEILEVAEILNQISHVFIHEMAATRESESDLQMEEESALYLAKEIENEMELVRDLSEREAKIKALSFKIPEGFDISFLIDFDESADLKDTLKSLNARRIKPPSGRETPLLKIAAEAISVPTRPPSIVYQHPSNEGLARGCLIVDRNLLRFVPRVNSIFHDNSGQFPTPQNGRKINRQAPHAKRLRYSRTLERPILKSVEAERAEYRLALRMQHGSLLHRIHAVRQMKRVCDLEEVHNVTREELQLAIAYCVYTSRSVRRMICMQQNEMRAPEWAPLHERKTSTFMGGLNVFTEKYHLNELSVQNYLYSLRHLHTFNFAMMYTDAEIDEMKKTKN